MKDIFESNEIDEGKIGNEKCKTLHIFFSTDI